ncbi:hypothetical protein MCOR27_002517 [Pyricularia oryzae]|uniref:Alpha N-terminal protein methyltransferase 1 n=4 Tax=Pyricularia TaxID=48558 RepID=A0ABQ8N9B1_PYRGI|nr:uncharacterized protein MGG_05014 [Pyricularia oryzae 70-15]ELQ43055.1 DUF858 domain-containing protein [Pyricularia oryzae Y34]KAH8847908.1 hypothetical protein MCOR01_001302 [Pyricularia oryzae]KAI6292080.1 hypothetical protein MCOR33_010138 [Pyricularia grisea]EHA52711.1 hypothetical protein MGG_05014 [Pyricularia oryzae 70-15]KAI6252572.1 hypothetical protein MCOR19_010821 [Pyricularia oryzae]
MTSDPAPSASAPDSRINTKDGRQYWEAVNADVDGMLGGFPYVTKVDLQGSKNFLAKMGIGNKEGLRIVQSAMEGGAGIGRITKGLLLHVAEQVDIVEPIAKFTEGLSEVSGVRTVSNIGLEEWTPPPGMQYDLVWTQWCLGHLTDQQVVAYLERCKAALVPETGFIVVKENLNTGIEDLFDDVDSSVTRRDEKFLELFKAAGLRLVKSEIQKGMPKELFPVKTYALR